MASADFVFEMNNEYSGGTVPSGPGPWAFATFAQTGANQVTLTMDLSPLDDNNATAFVSKWLFNVTSPQEDNLAAISIAYVSGKAASGVTKSKNGNNAGGGSKYDILFSFPTNNGNRFLGGMTSVYTFTAAGITPEWFYALSQGGGKGPFYTALHVQALVNGGSGWLNGERGQAIPLPSAAAMGLAGVGLLAARRHR
jgi:hypothetical protein